MAAPTANEITRLLRAWDGGDREALDKLIPVVYGELRRTARQYMALETPGRTIQPTEVVNEVYLRLADLKGVGWKDRTHFFALCSRMMRRILTDFARSRHTRKRGGEAIRVSLEEVMPMSPELDIDWLALDDALSALAQFDERKCRVVELRFFGGLNFDEAAAVLGVSTLTAKRDWKTAKVWLLRELRQGKRNGG